MQRRTLPWRMRVLIGSVAWLTLGGLLWTLFSAPQVRAPLARVWAAHTDRFVDAPERERVFAVPDARGVAPGDPVFWASEEQLEAPVGFVVAVEPPAAGTLGAPATPDVHGALDPARLRVRFAPGFELEGPLTFTCLAPSRSFAEAVALAVPPGAALRLGEAVRERVEATFQEAVRPELEARLPAFLARLDPGQDPRSRAEIEALAQATLVRVRPLLAGLTREITQAVDERFDLLGRVGLLWKLLRGDGEGLRNDLLPVAQAAATTWWTAHAPEVIDAVGAAFKDREAPLRAWIEGPLWETARDELLLPAARAQRERLTAEAEALLARAVAEIVTSPGGGLRPRFASVVRTHLLGHETPLLLVARGAAR